MDAYKTYKNENVFNVNANETWMIVITETDSLSDRSASLKWAHSWTDTSTLSRPTGAEH